MQSKDGIVSDWCEIPEFYVEAWPKANKVHACCECSALILPGEKHGKFTGKWDGRMRTYRQHIVCCEACVFIRDKFQDGECIGFGELSEYYKEYTFKSDEHGQELRRKMAKIIWRERGDKRNTVKTKGDE